MATPRHSSLISALPEALIAEFRQRSRLFSFIYFRLLCYAYFRRQRPSASFMLLLFLRHTLPMRLRVSFIIFLRFLPPFSSPPAEPFFAATAIFFI